MQVGGWERAKGQSLEAGNGLGEGERQTTLSVCGNHWSWARPSEPLGLSALHGGSQSSELRVSQSGSGPDSQLIRNLCLATYKASCNLGGKTQAFPLREQFQVYWTRPWYSGGEFIPAGGWACGGH